MINRDKFRLKTRKGLSLIELIFVVILLGVVVYTMWRVFLTGSKTTTRLSKSIEIAQAARLCDTRIAREIREGVEILSPLESDGAPESSPVLIMLTGTNELIVFYVNEKQELIRHSRTQNNNEKVIGRNVSAFRVFRKGRRLVNYHLEMAVEDKDSSDGLRRFSLITSVTLRNPVN